MAELRRMDWHQGMKLLDPSKLGRVWTHARTMGVWDALRCALISVLFRARPDDSAFDRRYGTETSTVWGVRFDEQPASGQIVRSGSIHPAVMRNILDNLGADTGELTFVDFGSGKGRALLCAAALPFKRIVGVEWSTDLCAIARRNIEVFRLRHPAAPAIEVTCSNVLDYEMPPGPVIVYTFNPFGPKLTRQVFEKIGRHAHETPDRCLIVFAGADDPEFAFVYECFRDVGIRVLHESRTLDLHSSWVLGEAIRNPLFTPSSAPVG